MISENKMNKTVNEFKDNLNALFAARDFLEGFAYDSYVSPSGVLDRSDTLSNAVETVVFDYEKATLRQALTEAETILTNSVWNLTQSVRVLEEEIRGVK